MYDFTYDYIFRAELTDNNISLRYWWPPHKTAWCFRMSKSSLGPD